MWARRRRLVAALGAALALAVIAAVATPPLIRARIDHAARARNLAVTVGHVRLGWFSVSLRDIRISSPGLPMVAEVAGARIDLSWALSPSGANASGVLVRVEGAPRDVEAALRSWHREPSATGGGADHSIPVAVDGLSLVWLDRPGGEVLGEANGGTISRESGLWRLRFEASRGRIGSLGVEATRPELRLTRSGALDDLHATRVSVEWSRESSQPPTSSPGSGEPAPPPLPTAGGGGDDSTGGERLRLPELRLLRAGVEALGGMVERAVIDGAQIQVDSLAFEISESGRRLAVGHGPLTAARKGSIFQATFSTESSASGTPVSTTVNLPLGEGDAVLTLAGGPVSLALLGVDEGAGGLVDVGNTTVSGHGRVALDRARGALTFDGDVAVHALAINRVTIASDTVRGIDGSAILRGVLDDHGSLRLDDGQVSLGALRVGVHGHAEQAADHLAASLGFEVPTTACGALFQSLPSALVPSLDGAEIGGTLGARGQLAFDSRNLDDLLLEWKVDDRCSMSVVPEPLAKERFAQPFEHTVYLPDGSLSEETTGPTTDTWTPLDRISPFMQVAVLTTEDGAFYSHHGFNRAAMRNALVADLKAGRFVRGASTITMQLAKNLFLFREKTLARKLEEIILADYLEENFTKKEMMELYLNVIEFGPDVYGVTQAAFHYFGRKPDELNLAESLFLASLLPSPLRFAKLAEKPELSEGWTKHLRQLMAIAAKNELISPEELADGMKAVVVFHDPQAPLPPPRPAVSGTHFQPPSEEGQAEWKETRTN